jgi:hypothetical protein
MGFKAHVGDLRDFKIVEKKYSLILAAGASLNFLKKSEIQEVATRVRRGVKKGGFVYVSVISTNDPFFKKLRSQETPIEKNTFFVSHISTYVHYFTYEEIEKLRALSSTSISLNEKYCSETVASSSEYREFF